jgi:hypothetical protein
MLFVDYFKLAVLVLHIESPDTFMRRPFHVSPIGLGGVDVNFISEFFSLAFVCCSMHRFLGLFAKFQKATFSFVMSVLPSVNPSVQLRFHYTNFHEN